jgi:hypothetical protein
LYCVGSFGPQLERFAAFFPLFDVSPLWHGGKQRQTAFIVRETLFKCRHKKTRQKPGFLTGAQLKR